MERETVAHCDLYVYLSHHHYGINISPFFLQILWATHSKISPTSTLFVQKFPWEELGFTLGLCCIFKCLAVSLFLYFNRCTRYSEKVSACRRTIRASEMKTPPPHFLDGNSMWLCLRLVYLWFFDHDSMRRCLIPGVLWQFACWQKALQCLKLDQRRQGLKSRRPAGRRSEKTQTFSESHCEVHSGFWLP